MRAFITGSQGQLARCLADLSSSKFETVFGARPAFDLTQPQQAAAQIEAAKPDVVINAAAYTAVDKAESDKDAAFAVNRDGARAVAAAAAKLGVPVIHVSTDYVFSGDKTSAYVETDETGPTGVYGASKLAGEAAVQEVAEKHLIIRTAWVYSVYGANFVKTMLRVGKERAELRVVNDQHGNPTSAHDLAAAIADICLQLEDGNSSWGTYHLAGTGETTWHEFALTIFETAKMRGLTVPKIEAIPSSAYPTPAVRPKNSRLSCAKAKSAFGLELPHWRASVGRCVNTLLKEQVST